MPYLKKAGLIFPATLIVLLAIFYFGFSAPQNFSSPKTVSVAKGDSLLKIGKSLKREGVVRSEIVFVILEKIASAEHSVKAGDYLFEQPSPVFNVVTRLAKGDFGIEQRKVVVVEGSTVKDISALMSGFTNFNKEKFLEKAQTKEGYLFPDTYYLFSNTTEDNLLSAMEDNFNDKIRTVEEEIKNSGRSLKEVVTMASIIEKEVAKPEDRVVVSGILWKRIEKGIPLQVDAATSTYLSKGLPPAPICNPGLGAIKAALEPQDSSYFFYLTGKDGKTYFAKTFDEHKKNKEKYLNK